ncbi:MAG: helix-turn-helix transcriptional regulator [Halobacterium sp.]
MQGSRGARWLVVAVALAAAAPAVGGASGVLAPSGHATPVQPAVDGAAVQPEVDNTVTTIEVAANGTATWTVAVRTRLSSDQEVSNYEAFQQEFRANTSQFLDPYRDRIRGVVSSAANATGREMTATDFSASTSIQELPRRWGVVTYEFTWHGFAATDGDRVLVGDVFQGGYYLAEDDLLELVTPPAYRVADVAPTPDARENGTLRWSGPLDFGDERPSVEYAPATTDAATSTTVSTTAPSQAASDGGFPWLAVLLAAVVAMAAGLLFYRRRGGAGGGDGSGGDSGGATGAESGGGSGGGGAAAAGSSTGAGAAPATATSGPVTDEERVRDLLAAEGGRVEQADIADALDWSASKTSRVVSRMADEGSVEKLRIGRKNVIELKEESGD